MGKKKEKEKESMATTNEENGGGEHSSSSSSSSSSIVILEDGDKKLADSISVKLSEAGSSTPRSNQLSIYRVHKKFRKIDKFAYRPEMVSIGPFHHGERSLPKMDELKLRYVDAFFSRASSPTVHECVVSLRGLEAEARKCYSESFDQDSDDRSPRKEKKNKKKAKLESDHFIEMMLLDGLFIIELFRKNFAQKFETKMQQDGFSLSKKEEEKDDLIFSNIWRKSSLVRDMILLGNQLPMSVLEHLFNISTTTTNTASSISSPIISLTMLALHFFDPLMPRRNEVLDQYSECKGMHLLDLFKKTFQLQLDTITNTNNNIKPYSRKTTSTNQSKFIPSVTELRVAGVRFNISEKDSFLDIKFSNGVLEIPPVVIHEQMNSLMSNLIAAEQCYDGGANTYSYMTSYAFLMDSLLNSPKDVEFLRDRGIIVRYLNKDEDVSDLFTKLCSEVTLTNFYYSVLCDQVNDYYNTHWKIWRASWLETAKREFFNNPWTIFSFFAAILIIFLTLLQTIFTTLSYYQGSSHNLPPGGGGG